MSLAFERYEALLAELRAEFPRFRLVRKDRSRGQRALHLALVALTAGRMRRYLSDYQTTIGATVYVTPDWDDRDVADRYVTLRHERVHLRQFASYGTVLMSLLYLLVPVPIGLAWCRAHFEKQAYAETIVAAAEVFGPERVRDARFRGHIIDQFTGPSYAWMWPFRRAVGRWYDQVAAGAMA